MKGFSIDTDLSTRIAEIMREEGRGPACADGAHSLDLSGAEPRCTRCGRPVEIVEKLIGLG